jgi:membrane protein DedA with SNARE-associated domain
VLIVGAIYAGAGRLNLVLVALLGFLGAVVGDNIGYLIGRHGGRRLVEKVGRYIFLTPERIDKAERFSPATAAASSSSPGSSKDSAKPTASSPA